MSHAAADSGFMAHVRAWFAHDVEPDLTDLKAAAAKVREMAPEVAKLAGLVEAMARADPGLSPDVVAEVGEVAGVVARIAAELAVIGV